MKTFEDLPSPLEIPDDREDIKRLVATLRAHNRALQRALERDDDAIHQRYLNERRLRALINNAPICIHEIHRDGSLQSMNPQGLSMLEARCEADLIGTRYLDAVSAQDRPRVAELMERAFRGEASEFTFIAAGEGAPRTFASSFVPIFDELGSVERLMGCTREITLDREDEAHRRAREVQTLQDQRLESLGLLAGGVAHEFNNLLTAILGSLSLAQTLVDPSHAAHDLLRDAEDAVQQGARRCQQLLAYAGKGRFETRVVPLRHLVASTTRALRSTLPESVTLSLDLPTTPLAVEGVPAQLKQCLINLVINASEALHGAAGRVEVTLKSLALDPSDVASLGALEVGELRPGEYTRLSVIDDGPGLPVGPREALFEPFPVDGSPNPQLGLAAVAGIVRAHHGALRLESTPGHGARFDIYLPSAPSTELQEAPGSQAPTTQPTRTILIVDDQPIVRQVTRKVLATQGFQVEEATSGPQALQRLSRSRPPIDLVLLDIAMPGMSGIEALTILRESHPTLPVVLFSGWESRSVDISDDPHTSFLSKPFQIKTLMSTLDAALDPPGS